MGFVSAVLLPLTLPWFKLEPWTLPLPVIGDLAIQPFGLLAAIAILVGAPQVTRRAHQLGVAREVTADFITVTTVAGLVSAYVLNAVLYQPTELWQALSDPPRLWSRWWGLSSYGGFVGGLVAALIFCARRRAPLIALADAWCYGIVFAWIFARLGCFVVHDHPGVASDFVLAVENYNGGGVARHDLGLYEALWALAVAPASYVLSKRPRPAGFFLVLTPLLYGPLRFALDFLRLPAAQGGDARYLGLTPAQYFSLALTLAGLVLLRRYAMPSQTARSLSNGASTTAERSS